VDGNLLPPNIVNKLNIFMVNVLRFKGNNDLSRLIDRAGSHNVRFDVISGDVPEDGPPAAEVPRELVGAAVAGEGDPYAGCDGCN
jgi:hypothetical protein